MSAASEPHTMTFQRYLCALQSQYHETFSRSASVVLFNKLLVRYVPLVLVTELRTICRAGDIFFLSTSSGFTDLLSLTKLGYFKKS